MELSDTIYYCIVISTVIMWLMLMTLAIGMAVDAIEKIVKRRLTKPKRYKYFMRDIKWLNK